MNEKEYKIDNYNDKFSYNLIIIIIILILIELLE